MPWKVLLGGHLNLICKNQSSMKFPHKTSGKYDSKCFKSIFYHDVWVGKFKEYISNDSNKCTFVLNIWILEYLYLNSAIVSGSMTHCEDFF